MGVLKFPEENLKGLHFFVEHLNFPVVVATYSDWQETQVSYLSSNYLSQGFNSEAICMWCINHEIQYQILYPMKRSSIIKHPYKYFKFVKLKKKLNYSL